MAVFFKLVVTVAIGIAAIPGLIVEPGPLSELTALGIIVAMWSGDKSPEEAVQEAAGAE